MWEGKCCKRLELAGVLGVWSCGSGSWSERRLEDPSQLVCCWSRWHCNGEEHRPLERTGSCYDVSNQCQSFHSPPYGYSPRRVYMNRASIGRKIWRLSSADGCYV